MFYNTDNINIKRKITNKKTQPIGKTLVTATPAKSVSNTAVFTFMITYTILLTTATITFIEALRTKTPYVRHILNLETCISLVAGYYYGVFITKVQDVKKPVDWSEITKLRYIDWSITTPMMLLTLSLVLALNSNTAVHFPAFISIIVLNYCMLFMGYMGEAYPNYRLLYMIGGFIPFTIMFYLIYKHYYGKNIMANKIMFSLYLGVWGLYGIVYMFEEITKNICYNILDLIAKCLIGLGLWVYYAGIIKK
jgi:bacteriorhodopsin